MSDAIHHDSPDSVHDNLPDQRVKHRAASFGFTAICVILLAVSAGLAFKLKKQNALMADVQAQVAKANSDTASAKAQLADVTTKSTDLQSQLDQAKRAQVDLQAQIKKGEENKSALQAQLSKGQKDFQSQQETTKTQLAELQAQLGQSNTSAAGLRKELEASKAQISDLQGQLAKAQEGAIAKQAPVVAEARPLPLTTEIKKSFFGGTFTLKINNPGTAALKVDLDISGSPNTQGRSTTIAAGGSYDVKDLAAGARVAIASEGYTPLSVTIK